jgi:hypothetical protein
MQVPNRQNGETGYPMFRSRILPLLARARSPLLLAGLTTLLAACEQGPAPLQADSARTVRQRATTTNTQELGPAADTWALATNPTANSGGDTELRTKQLDGNGGRRAFLKFNLGGLSGTVQSAKLRLYGTYLDTGAVLAAAGVSDDGWTESGLTWSNQPAPGATLDTASPAAGQWLEFDVTDFVSQQLSGDRVASLAVLEQTLGHDNNFASREYPTADLRPVLVVTTGFDHNPVADAWVLASNPDTNYGGDTELRTKQLDSTSGRRAFLKFSLQDVSDTIVSARLRLYNTYAQAGATLALKSVTDDAWSETDLTWNNQPALGATLASGAPVADGWFDLDVTGYVSQQAAGDKLVSFALVEQTTGHDTNFASREDGAPEHRPVLEVTTSTDYAPVGDASVVSSSATTNYGAEATLTTKQLSTTAGRRSFLKFDLGAVSGSVQSATLRLYNVYAQPSSSVAAVAVTADGWTESGLTWNNQPALGATLSAGVPGLNQWLELDVTDFVNQQLVGDKLVSLGLIETTLQHDNNFASREGAADQRPQLRLRMAPVTTSVGIARAASARPEGQSGATPLTFTLTRSGDVSGTSSVGWAVSGAAVNGTDFVGGVLPSGTVGFAAGETSATLTVNAQGDTTVEPDEDFTVTLSNPTGCGLGVNSARGTLQNDDGTLPTVSIAATNAAQLEGNSGATAFTFTVSRSASSSASSVSWAVSGTAVDGSDFSGGELPSGTVSFAAGETSKVLTVNVRGDLNQESDEAFVVTLSNPAGCALGTSSAPGTLQNDDGSLPTVNIAAAAADQDEGNSGTTPFTFTVTRGTNVSGTSSVKWAVSGTAVNAADFVGGVLPSGTLSFAVGDSTKSITVNVQGDTTAESDESFTVSLSGCGGCGLGTATASGLIRDEDSADPYPNHPSLDYGPGTRVVPADSQSLQNKLRDAKPGDRILLSDGTYDGTYTIAATTATRANPIVIEAVNRHRAVFTGQFNLKGNWTYLVGARFQGSGATVVFSGSQNMVARCFFLIGPARYSTAARILAGSRNRFTRNELTLHPNATSEETWGLRVGKDKDAKLPTPTNPLIDRNYFHDWPYSPTQIEATEALQLGLSRNTHEDRIEALVEYNLFREVHRDNETVSVKSSYNTFRYNTVDRASGGNGCKFVQNRHGHNNKYLGNTFDGVHGLKVGDKDIEANGNVFMNTLGKDGLLVNAGDCDPDQYEGNGGCYPSAENALLIGNKADHTFVGNEEGSDKHPWTVPALNTRIEGHQDGAGNPVLDWNGSLERNLALEKNTSTIVRTPSKPVISARRVLPSQVGPSYP